MNITWRGINELAKRNNEEFKKIRDCSIRMKFYFKKIYDIDIKYNTTDNTIIVNKVGKICSCTKCNGKGYIAKHNGVCYLCKGKKKIKLKDIHQVIKIEEFFVKYRNRKG